MKHFKFISLFLFTILCTLPAFAGGIPELDTVWTSKILPTPALINFAPDDSYIVSLDGNGVLRFYTVNNCDTITTISAKTYGDDGFHTLNFSNDGKYLLTNSGKRFYQFDAKTFKLIKTFGDTTDVYLKDAYNPGFISLSSDGQYVAMVSTYYNYEEIYDSIMVYDINTGKKVKTIVLPITDAVNGQRAVGIYDIGFTLDNQYLLVNGFKVYNQGKFEYTTRSEFAYDAKTLEISKISNIPWLGNKMSKDWSTGVKYDGSTITIFKYPSNEIIRTMLHYAHTEDLSFDFSNDNKYIIIDDMAGLLEVLNLSTGDTIANWNKGSKANLHISNNDKYFIVDNYNVLQLFKTPWNSDFVADKKDNETTILYPNPTNNTVTISLELTEPSKISAGIYDQNGKEIKTISYGLLGTGLQSITVDVSYLSTGSYFLRLQYGILSKDYKLSVVR